MTNSREMVFIAGILALSFFLRFWGVGGAYLYIADEAELIPASGNYLASGNFSPDSWEHPPLKYFLLSAGIKTFGNNAYGWRMKNVLLGSLTVLVLYLFCREVLNDRRIAVTAALLLAFDPAHVLFSRTVYGEIPSILFLLLAVYITVLYLNGKISSPFMAGICLGLALASKWYYLTVVPVLFATALIHSARNRLLSWQRVLHLFSVYALLPAAVYLVPFYPWFGRGYSLPEFAQMQLDAYIKLQNQPLAIFTNPFFRTTPSSPWEWFVKPLITGVEVFRRGAWSIFFIFMSNPPFWLLTIPAALYASYRAWKERDWRMAFVVLLFLSLYFQFVLVARPLFLYSAVVLLPFAYLLVAYFLTSIPNTLFRSATWPYRALLTCICLWGFYLYPLVTNKNIPVVLYKPLFLLGTVYLQ